MRRTFLIFNEPPAPHQNVRHRVDVTAKRIRAVVMCGADLIVTRNERDFKGALAPALNREAFLRRHGAAA